MSDNIQETKKVQFLLTSLILLVVFILVLILMIGAYNLYIAPDPTLTPTASFTPQPSFTPTNTFTTTPSPTYSRTPGATITPKKTAYLGGKLAGTHTPTQPGPPTLTPARPVPQAGRYNLKLWTDEDAQYVIQLLNDYPNLLPVKTTEQDLNAYYSAFRFASHAQREALMQFPDSPYAKSWEWGLAYNLALIGDISSGDQYSNLILKSLNSGETDLKNLYIWFKQQEPRLDLYLTQLEPPEDYVGSYLAEIRGEGSTFIWLLESDQAFRAYDLLTFFDFVNSPESSWVTAELDGDTVNGDEIAIYFSTPDEKTTLDPPAIYNLSQIPPRQMPFIPNKEILNLGMEYENYWAIQPGVGKQMDLVFRSSVFPACAVIIEQIYRWNKHNFELIKGQFSIDKDPLQKAYCDLVSKHAAYTWGPEAALQIMEPLLESWPPEKTMDGSNFATDARDEWLYRMAIQSALSGDQAKARTFLQTIIESPSVPRSNWITPALEFLEKYLGETSVYQVCISNSMCEPAEALSQLIDMAPKDQELLSYLRQSGVNLTSSGFFDFDDDAITERWFNVKHRALEKPEFWIIAAHKSGVTGIRVSQVESNPPDFYVLDEPYIHEQSLDLQPAIFLDGSKAFHLARMPENEFPYVVDVDLRQEYPDRYRAGLDVIEASLFRGDSPKQAQKDLLNLAVNPGLLCVNTWTCDSYYYLLGLASELAGDERSAVEAYHRLWSDYSKSPYTTIARLKLLGSPLLTSTPTLTLTPTTTLTPTATLSPTPTVTGTPPTTTPTATLTFTPDPNLTATPTLTLTPTITLSPTISTTAYPYPYP